MAKFHGANLAGGESIRGRENNDFYATPAETTRAILKLVDLHGSILEPAAGMGHISEVLKEFYPNNEIISTDLINRGYGIGGIDFLTHDFGGKFDNIITNPPFKYMKEFAQRGLELANDKVILFGKIQFLEGKTRKDFLMKSPLKTVYVFSERQNPMRAGRELDEQGRKWAGTVCYCWYVWEKGYQGPTMVNWI